MAALANIDLNLLVSLDALLRARSVTRAAAGLGLSQPTLSTALSRLRRHYDDELLTRVGNSYELTPLGSDLLSLPERLRTGRDLSAHRTALVSRPRARRRSRIR